MKIAIKNVDVLLRGAKRESKTKFVGFLEDQEAFAKWKQARFEARNQSDSESDISVSASEDLSDSTDYEEEEETGNVKEDPIEVSPFTVANGPTSGVVEDGTAIDFFHLMFPEELIEHNVVESNCYAQECIATKPDRE